MFGIKADDPSTPFQNCRLNTGTRQIGGLSTGHKLLGERFLVVNFDKLCMNPWCEIERLIDFLGIDPKHINIHELVKLPKSPESAGRYKKCDLSIFERDEIEAVRELGLQSISNQKSRFQRIIYERK